MTSASRFLRVRTLLLIFRKEGGGERGGVNARQDKIRLDKTRQDKVSQDKTRQDQKKQDKITQDNKGQDKTRQDLKMTYY